MELIVYILAGIAIGGVLVYLILNRELKKIKADKDNYLNELSKIKELTDRKDADIRVYEEKINIVKQSFEDAKAEWQITKDNTKKELSGKEEQIILLNKELAAKSSDLKNLLSKLEDQKKEVEDIREKFKIEFENLANKIFEDKSRKFTDQNKSNISDLLKPLSEKIKDFEKKVEETYDKESKQRFSLKEEVKRLAELNQQISKEASNLTNALKGESKTQGNWGEMILESILEKSGLTKDREYFVQPSFTDTEGKRLQPDVVISYPGNKHVVVDSKVSLVAYEKYVSATDKNEKEIAAKEHLNSVKHHIDELSKKNYQDVMIGKLNSGMITNLIAALKMIKSLWQQEHQSKNVEEIAKKSGELYDKFVGFTNDLEEIGKKLNSTQQAYNNSINKLSTGKGNLVKRVQDIKKLGAKTKKSIPDIFLKNISEDSDVTDELPVDKKNDEIISNT